VERPADARTDPHVYTTPAEAERNRQERIKEDIRESGLDPNRDRIPNEIRSLKLPGKLVVATVLNSVHFFADLNEIDGANETRTNQKTDRLNLDERSLEAYFNVQAGNTVIVVGHVEGREFVLTDDEGHRAQSIELSRMMMLSNRHRVLLVPIGCNTAAAGAPIGFMQNITGFNVASFVKQIPQAATVGNIVDEMQKVGRLHIAQEAGTLIFWSRSDENQQRIALVASGDISEAFHAVNLNDYAGRNTWEPAPTSESVVFFGWIVLVPTTSAAIDLALWLLSRSSWLLGNRRRSRWLPLVVGLRTLAGAIWKIAFGIGCVVAACALIALTGWFGLATLWFLSVMWSLANNDRKEAQ